MGSLATFKSTYLAPTGPVPIGQRSRLAGAIYAIDQQVAGGAAHTTAVNSTANRKNIDAAFNAQRWTSPYNANLVSDYLTISAA